ncbi:MAG: GTPase HflX [Rikenellaceae bacterium]|nr:GTPase HflX [Rikenellaceae bacterium]
MQASNGIILNDNERERAVLVSVQRPIDKDSQITEYLDELAMLADTAGASVVRRFTQKLPQASSRTYVGPGKLSEIAAYIEENAIDTVIFDDELSPTQQRNIEAELKVKVLDRTSLILDIFASRAQTAYAKTQVELAQYKYLLPRLTGMWTHLERQRGGIGMRGPGEREIETDRRIIRDKIKRLEQELGRIDRQMATQRSGRNAMVRVALVGYTNVGKSTIMNLLSKSDVFAEDKLFATLDTTVRKVVIDNIPFLLSDTVGFIRKLPHQLIESFKSTLDEVREADLLLHVVDVSHPNFEEQYEVVNRTLEELGAAGKPLFLIFNKMDAYRHTPKAEDDLTESTKENVSLDELISTWMGKMHEACIFISAKERINLTTFRRNLYAVIRGIHHTRYPHNNYLF